MKVRKDGTIYKVSRITGPTHHILGVEFSIQACPLVVRDFSTYKEINDPKFVDCILAAFSDLERQNLIDIKMVKNVYVSQDDKPHKEAYILMLKEILNSRN